LVKHSFLTFRHRLVENGYIVTEKNTYSGIQYGLQVIFY
jgi:hypothetical protein